VSGYLTCCGGPCRIALTALLIAVVVPDAGAQRLADLPSGTLLRVRMASTRDWREGTFVAITPDSLALQGPEQLFAVPRGQIRALERRDRDASRTSHVLTGGAIGALAGVTVVIAGMIHCEHGQQNDMCGVGVLFVPPAAAIGFAFGAIIGALPSVERWCPVELPHPFDSSKEE
jgi:hypothetical protein